jgi:hypothetical protein
VSAPHRSDEARDDDPEDRGVDDEAWAAENRRLPEDDRDHREVHRVAHVAVQAPDHEVLRGRAGERRPQALDHEADHRVREYADAGGDQQCADDL